MNLPHRSVTLALTLAALLSAQAGFAQNYNLTASFLAGIGGAFDVEPDSGFGNSSFQLGFTWATEGNILVGLRAGRLDFSEEDGFGSYDQADFTYVTAAGEYRIHEGYYDSGLYLGLGLYQLDGRSDESGDDSSSDLGFVLGLTGDFEITPRFSVLVELAAHLVDMDEAEVFGQGLVGLAVHF